MSRKKPNKPTLQSVSVNSLFWAPSDQIIVTISDPSGKIVTKKFPKVLRLIKTPWYWLAPAERLLIGDLVNVIDMVDKDKSTILKTKTTYYKIKQPDGVVDWYDESHFEVVDLKQEELIKVVI